MKRHLLCALLFFTVRSFISSLAIAQLNIVKRPRINLGTNIIYATPHGNFANAYAFGIGCELVGGIGVGSTYFIGSIGNMWYKATGNNSLGNLTTVPVKVGLKRYFLLKRFFINGDVGIATFKINNTSSSAFTAGFGAGIKLLGLEAALYYNTFKNNIGYSKAWYSNNTQAKIGWSFSL
ncbi:MAG: hypothetical protein M3040_02735 [Bacteroidota bacterium]|nr:hypothetical protein [Bacteroidota bacterium]